jgi:hypothetical protein
VGEEEHECERMRSNWVKREIGGEGEKERKK